MGIDWKMTRLPESVGEVIEDKKEDPDEGLWKPVAREIIEKDEKVKKEIQRKDPEVAKELGLEREKGLFDDGSDEFSIFD